MKTLAWYNYVFSINIVLSVPIYSACLEKTVHEQITDIEQQIQECKAHINAQQTRFTLETKPKAKLRLLVTELEKLSKKSSIDPKEISDVCVDQKKEIGILALNEIYKNEILEKKRIIRELKNQKLCLQCDASYWTTLEADTLHHLAFNVCVALNNNPQFKAMYAHKTKELLQIVQEEARASFKLQRAELSPALKTLVETKISAIQPDETQDLQECLAVLDDVIKTIAAGTFNLEKEKAKQQIQLLEENIRHFNDIEKKEAKACRRLIKSKNTDDIDANLEDIAIIRIQKPMKDRVLDTFTLAKNSLTRYAASQVQEGIKRADLRLTLSPSTQERISHELERNTLAGELTALHGSAMAPASPHNEPIVSPRVSVLRKNPSDSTLTPAMAQRLLSERKHYDLPPVSPRQQNTLSKKIQELKDECLRQRENLRKISQENLQSDDAKADQARRIASIKNSLQENIAELQKLLAPAEKELKDEIKLIETAMPQMRRGRSSSLSNASSSVPASTIQNEQKTE